MSTGRARRPASLITTGTGTHGFCTNIRIIRTCITGTSMSMRETPERPRAGKV